MSECDSYYLRWRGRLSGPFTLAELQEKASLREISRLHQVSADQAAWRPAESLAGVFAQPEEQQPAAAEPYAVAASGTSLSAADEIPEWYFYVNDTVDGPTTAFEIQEMIASGRLGAEDYISHIDAPEEWQTVGGVFPVSMPSSLKSARPSARARRLLKYAALGVAGLIVAGILVWLILARLS